MQNPNIPFALPEWQALARETDLAMQLICSGANEIGRADYTAHGRYATAQFGFSNGFERLGKIILTADSILTRGHALSDEQLRTKGHSLVRILGEVEEVANRHELDLKHSRPTAEIAMTVLNCLDDFAAASRGRYANHDSLRGSQSPHEPVRKWWNNVSEPILVEHFRGTKREAQARQESNMVGSILEQFSVTLHFHEDGSVVTNPARASFMTHERVVTQRWGRLYALQHARWMSDLFAELTRLPGYAQGTEILFGHYERLATFRVPDEFLLTRKTWPLG